MRSASPGLNTEEDLSQRRRARRAKLDASLRALRLCERSHHPVAAKPRLPFAALRLCVRHSRRYTPLSAGVAERQTLGIFWGLDTRSVTALCASWSLPGWRNGRRWGLKIPWASAHVGSTPTPGILHSQPLTTQPRAGLDAGRTLWGHPGDTERPKQTREAKAGRRQ